MKQKNKNEDLSEYILTGKDTFRTSEGTIRAGENF